MNEEKMQRAESRLKIAIIEDDDFFRGLLEEKLSGSGYDCWSVNSAEAFYRRMLSAEVDVVVCDLGLPGEDGLSMISYLRSVGNYGIVAITARSSVQDRIQGLQAGVDHYLPKPFEVEELTAALIALERRLKGEPKQAPAAELEKPPAEREESTCVLDSSSLRLLAPNGKAVILTGSEYLLALMLFQQPQITISKAQLSGNKGRVDRDEYHRIENTLLRLRKKVIRETGVRIPIHSVFGKGLAFTGAGSVL